MATPIILHKNWCLESGVTVTAASEATGGDYPDDNLLIPHPSEAWRSSDATEANTSFEIDLGAQRRIRYLTLSGIKATATRQVLSGTVDIPTNWTIDANMTAAQAPTVTGPYFDMATRLEDADTATSERSASISWNPVADGETNTYTLREYTFTVHVKKDDLTEIRLEASAGANYAREDYDLDAVTRSGAGSSNGTMSVLSASDIASDGESGWIKCTLVYSTNISHAAGAITHTIYTMRSGATNYTGVAGEGLWIARPHAWIGTPASNTEPTYYESAASETGPSIRVFYGPNTSPSSDGDGDETRRLMPLCPEGDLTSLSSFSAVLDIRQAGADIFPRYVEVFIGDEGNANGYVQVGSVGLYGSGNYFQPGIGIRPATLAQNSRDRMREFEFHALTTAEKLEVQEFLEAVAIPSQTQTLETRSLQFYSEFGKPVWILFDPNTSLALFYDDHTEIAYGYLKAGNVIHRSYSSSAGGHYWRWPVSLREFQR